MISYAGVGLTMPSADMESWMADWWHPECVNHFLPPGAGGIVASGNYPTPPFYAGQAPRLGRLYWPAGASRWSTFYAVVTGAELDLIRAAVPVAAPVPQNLIIRDNIDSTDTTHTITASMYMLTPRPITNLGDTANSAEKAWLLCLVDVRWFWWLPKLGPVGTTGGSWSVLLTSLLAQVGATATIDSIPAAYKTPDAARWKVKSAPFPIVIDAACAAIGARFTRDTAGTCRIWRPAAAKTAQAAQWTTHQAQQVYGGVLDPTDICRALPVSVKTIFDGATPDTRTTLLTAVGGTVGDVGSAVGIPDTSAQIYTEIFVGASSGQKDAYAIQAATDWYAWQLAGRMDAVLRGVVQWETSPAEAAVEWSDGTGDEPICTKIIAWPGGDWNIYGGGGAGDGIFEKGKWCRITGGETDGYYPAVLREPDGEGGRTDGDAIRVALMSSTGDLFENGKTYWVTLNGSRSEDQTPRTVTDAVTNSTATLTSATAAFSATDIGAAVTGSGIPANTTIASVESATSVTLSASATLSASGVEIEITPVIVFAVYDSPGSDQNNFTDCEDDVPGYRTISALHPFVKGSFIPGPMP